MKRYLDYFTEDGKPVLLDGKGGLLPADGEPVYLDQADDEKSHNSRGELFADLEEAKAEEMSQLLQHLAQRLDAVHGFHRRHF